MSGADDQPIKLLQRQQVHKMCIYTMSMASLLILVYLVLSFASVSRVLGKLECQETANPVSPSDSGHMLMTASADEARNTAVCHAICIKYIFESQGSPNGSNGTAATKGAGLDGGSGSSMMEIKVCAYYDLPAICCSTITIDGFVTDGGAIPAQLHTI